jgi:hypothetical protein
MIQQVTRNINEFLKNKDLYSKEEQEAIRQELKREADLAEEQYFAAQEV